MIISNHNHILKLTLADDVDEPWESLREQFDDDAVADVGDGMSGIFEGTGHILGGMLSFSCVCKKKKYQYHFQRQKS